MYQTWKVNASRWGNIYKWLLKAMLRTIPWRSSGNNISNMKREHQYFFYHMFIVRNVYLQALQLATQPLQTNYDWWWEPAALANHATKCDRCEKTLPDDQDGQECGSKRTGPQPNQHIEIVEVIRYLDSSIVEPRLVLSTSFPNWFTIPDI